MRENINNYGINNPDGLEQYGCQDARSQKYDNDNPKFFKEDSLKDQRETTRVAENFRISATAEDDDQKAATMELSNEASSAASSSAMASATASVGGSIGALAGVVVASVVAAVVVVAVFLSTLSINLSLIMAEMDSLVLEVQMTGAQEEDFATPIYAILTGDEVYQEQIIDPDRLTLTFDDLQPGTQYRVTIKNEEKVFFESNYFTSTTPSDKGEIVSRIENTDVYVTIQNASLKPTEHYTLVAKDAQGNIVYQIDGVEAFTEYHFNVDPPKNLYFYLMVNGKTYAVDSIELPEYDFANGVWTWENNNLTAKVTFADKKGGEALVLDATVTRKTTEATCETDGSIVYTAKATYEGKTFTNKQTTVLESLGHNYEGTYENGHFTYTCSVCGDSYTDEDQQP